MEEPRLRSRAVDDGVGHIFDATKCPYCRAEQSPPPKRSGTKCTSCGEKVDIDRTLDGICSLVRLGEGNAEKEWADHQAAEIAYWQDDPKPLGRIYRRWLKRYARLGLRVCVEVWTGEGHGCRSCREIGQGDYAPSKAPALPNPSCTASDNGKCVCQYRPVMPER